MTPIQYGQEMYDQSSIVRDAVRFSYEMRYPEQGDVLVKRAHAIATAAPGGPVYLSLPREPLAEAVPEGFAPAPVAAGPSPAMPDPAALAKLAVWLAEAERPVILCQRGDVAGRLGPALSALGSRCGIGVAEPFSVRNVLATEDPALIGYDAKAALEGADVVVVLDSAVPWIAALHAPGEGARVAHVGPDPQFRRMPVRGYRSDLSLVADPVLAVEALAATLPDDEGRAEALAARTAARIGAEVAAPGRGSDVGGAWLSACVSEVMDEDAVAFTELGLLPGAMRLCGQNRLFGNPHSGGLGWAMPAALGAQLARPGELTIAAMGDGSYMFANPVACHQIAEALGLPILTIVKNNAMWNAVRRSVVKGYPEGAAARMNRMPLTSLAPLPDFCAIARASRAHAERVERGADLPAALERALAAVRGGQQALIDCAVTATDEF